MTVTTPQQMAALAALDGEWVALLNGEVVDHDPDPGVLYRRLTELDTKSDRFFKVSAAPLVDSVNFPE